MSEIDDRVASAPNTKWRLFFLQFHALDITPVEQWDKALLLGYFCRKYQEAFGVVYTFKFNATTPAKSFEVWKLNTIGARLSMKPEILKGYIDWIFATKAKSTKRRFTSISFLAKDEFVMDYKMNVVMAAKAPDRSTPLPEAWQQILQENNLSVPTYGDLIFFWQVYLSIDRERITPVPSGHKNPFTPDTIARYDRTVERLRDNGFDPSMLVGIV